MLKSVHHVPEHLSTMSPDRTVGEGWGEGIKPHILQLRKYLTRCVDGVIDIFFAVRHGHKARFKR